MYRISDLVSAGGGRPALHGERDRARSVAAIASSGVAYHQPTFRLVYCTTRGGTLENNVLAKAPVPAENIYPIPTQRRTRSAYSSGREGVAVPVACG